MIARIVIGLALTAVAASALAGRRLRWLYRVARAGPAGAGADRGGAARTRAGTRRSKRPR